MWNFSKHSRELLQGYANATTPPSQMAMQWRWLFSVVIVIVFVGSPTNKALPSRHLLECPHRCFEPSQPWSAIAEDRTRQPAGRGSSHRQCPRVSGIGSSETEQQGLGGLALPTAGFCGRLQCDTCTNGMLSKWWGTNDGAGSTPTSFASSK